MKKLLILTVALTAFTLMSFNGEKFHTDVYKVDTKVSSLEWYAEKVTGKHNGTIRFLSGDINNNHGHLNGVFEFDMTSIENTDMKPGNSKTKLENHLKSPDFFDVAIYPTSKFIMTLVAPVKELKEGGPTHTVKGLLTIKDKTNGITFDATIKLEGTRVSCVGSAIVDRSKFDVKYGSKTFFEDIGDKMINDEFTLKFNVIAFK